MNKVFLSHSSQNKDFVRPIAKYFGNDRCVFDEVTFETGLPTLDEIFKQIEYSDIFVYFISDAALKSSWVEQEINKAQEILNNDTRKLSQIFPIIIDSTITHDDTRIPSFLRQGFGAYNLRHIDSEKIACKKIETQLIALAMRENDSFAQKSELVGRDIEKKKFKDYFEERTLEGKIKHIKCLVVSGIHGIGKKAYIRGTLKEMGLMEKHYFPMTISLEREETIDDLIVKISDLGFGGYGLSDIIAITDMHDKTEILVELLVKAQKYLEHIIVEDNGCLLDENGILKYWFENALESMDNQITMSIVSLININSFNYRKSQYLFTISLEELSLADSIAMLRKLSKLEGIPFSEKHIDQVASVLSGYPPQVEYCVELALENGINYVVNNQYEIFNMPDESASKVVELAIDSENNREVYLSLLALLSKFGSTPMSMVDKVVKVDNRYKGIITRLRRFNICTYTGTSREYLKINPIVRDYIQRMKYDMSPEVKSLITSSIEEFQSNITKQSYTDYLDFSELTLYLKENVKKGNSIPDKFLYSTLFVQAIMDLYNEKEYEGVIKLMRSIKEKGDFIYLDKEIKKIMQFYFCSSLARRHSLDFDTEVLFFQDEDDYQRYNFLNGFQARLNGHYARAEQCFSNVLNRNFNHHTARREMVLVYSNLQDYEAALELARINYKKFPENIFHLQAFFDCIIRQAHISENDIKLIDEMLAAAKTIHRSKRTEIYFQVEAKNQAFIKKNYSGAINYIVEGLEEFPTSFYLARDGFDICRNFSDLKGMEKYFSKLVAFAKNTQTDLKISMFYRDCYLKAYQKKPLPILKMQINSNNDIPQSSKDNLLQAVEKIHRGSPASILT